ncbi:hypothetical protein RBS60_02890 [Sinomonas sp. ASV486]|uniref:hypothetical protein n=1 Tax=Sinomonas sp. ASV486 TaxID=3051170 RepID=UPI0027DCD40D|nr:hypothetical protein [Sinomonas sp. ASV486]MDQ4489142.1 hypothetical protein [Sinomonas sp. ASV486]
MEQTPKVRTTARFLLWLLWPLGALIVLFVVGQTIENIVGKDTRELWVYPIYLAILAAMAVCAVWMAVHVVQALGMVRRRAGWHTRAERLRMDHEAAHRGGFERAVALKASLADGGQPLRLQPWDVMLGEGEVLLMDVPLQYSRWYGTHGGFTQSSMFAVGQPSFVAAALIGNAVGNTVRRNRAEAAAQAMWREQQTVRTLVTDRRVMCRTGGRWLSFPFGAVSASYPDPLGATLILEFHDTAPLLLHGYEGASVCVFATASLQGRDALRSHPALAALPEPQVMGEQ